MKKSLKLFPFLSLVAAISLYSCSQDEQIVNEKQNNSELVNSVKNVDDWKQYVTPSASATKDNSIVFDTQEEYEKFLSQLHATIDKAQDTELILDYKGKGVASKGCADGVYYGSGMTNGAATLGFDVSVKGGCITGVSGYFSGLTLGAMSYSQGGTSIGCKSASVCGNVNYNFFVEGIGTVYSQRICYKISLGC